MVTQVDPETNKKQTTIKVAFIDKDDEKMFYKFTSKEGEDAKTKIYSLPAEDDLDFPQHRYLDFF